MCVCVVGFFPLVVRGRGEEELVSKMDVLLLVSGWPPRNPFYQHCGVPSYEH